MCRPILSVILAAMFCLFLWFPYGADALSINDRIVEPSEETTEHFLTALRKALKQNPKGKLHGLATFSRYVSPDERTFLAKLGISVLEPYQETTYWVSLSKAPNLPQLLPKQLTFTLIPILDQHRVHPKILTAHFESFELTSASSEPFNYVLNTDGTLNLTVRFHVDVSEGQATTLLSKHTENFTKKSPLTWVVVISQTALTALAKEDPVQWIEAGPLPFLPENDNTSRAIKVDLVRGTGTPPIDGSGIRVGIFDGGINETHPDFGTRVTSYNWGAPGPPVISHGTGVVGVVAGSGLMSSRGNSFGCSQRGTPEQWMGMAPQAFIREQSWANGDDPVVYRNLITVPPGMHLSNHSYIISDLDGEYSEKDRVRDAMIRGTSPGLSLPPRLSVFSAGNQGMSNELYNPEYPQRHLYQKGYFSLTKQLKNGLVVGNWQAVEDNPPNLQYPKDRIAPTSSLGPTYDGRIKPDVVAPGRFVVTTDGPDTTTTSGCTSYYTGGTGTSFSAPAVTGSIALLLQRYANVYNIPDLSTGMPLPSTLRAIMIHTATDIETSTAWFCNPDGSATAPCPVGGPGHASVWAKKGPDFVTGWGLINAQAAVQTVTNKLLHEGTLAATCMRRTYAFSVTSDNPLRITLAWDDYPSSPQSPNKDRKLINDLDLVLIDPEGVRHYPWRLNHVIFGSNNHQITDPSLETCTERVTVKRQVSPTSSPLVENDLVPSGGFPPAVPNATDHLNNVEVVDVPCSVVKVPPPVDSVGSAVSFFPCIMPKGTWQAKVIAFEVPFGPQTFSLVGARIVDISVPPSAACKIHGHICTGSSLILDCQVRPEVCTNEIAFPSKPERGWVRVRLASQKDKSIIPVTQLCGIAFECPPCIIQKTCPRSFVRVDKDSNLQVGLYSLDGQRLRPGRGTGNQIRVNANDFLVVLSIKPGALVRTGDHEARIQISDGPIP